MTEEDIMSHMAEKSPGFRKTLSWGSFTIDFTKEGREERKRKHKNK